MTFKIICSILPLLWIPDSSVQSANLTDIQSTQISNAYLKSIAKHNFVFFTSAHLFFLQFSPSQKCHHHPPFTQARNQEQYLVSLSPCPASASSTGTASNHSICQREPLPSLNRYNCSPNSCHLSPGQIPLLPDLSAPLAPLLHSAARVVLLPLKWTEACPHVKLPEGVPLLFGSGRLLLLNAHHSHRVSCHHAPWFKCHSPASFSQILQTWFHHKSFAWGGLCTWCFLA